MNKTKFLIYVFVIVLISFMIQFLDLSDFTITGNTVVSFSNSNDFSNGTYTNTLSLGGGDIRLNRSISQIGYFTNSSSMFNPTGIDIVGNYAYIAGESGDSITIINITDPTSLTQVGYFTNSSLDGATFIQVLDDIAYIVAFTNDSITTINVTDPTNPTQTGYFANSSSLDGAWEVFVKDDYAYVSSSRSDSLTIINVTDPTNLTQVSEFTNVTSMDLARGISVSGDYAYIIASSSKTLTIINISDKTNPTQVGALKDTNKLAFAFFNKILDNTVYVPSGNYFFNVINVTDPTNPVQIGEIEDIILVDYGDSAFAISLSEDYAYITIDNPGVFIIIDITNKTSPSIVNTFENMTSMEIAYWFDIKGEYVYVAGKQQSSLTVLNLSYLSSGTYESNIIDAESTQSWDSVTWDETEFGGTNLSLSFRSCDDSACSGESYSGSDDSSPASLSVIDNRYFQFKATFLTSNNSATSVLNSIDITYSIPVADTTPTSDSGSSALIPESGVATVTKTNFFTEISVDAGATIKDFDEDIGISEIKIEINKETSDVKVTISKYDSKPTAVSKGASGSIYKYIQIEVENLEDSLEKAIIKIQVEKSWISNNSLEKDQIAMFKFDNISEEWNELTTIFIDEDDTFYFYEIVLDSFSFFVIGEKIIITAEIGEVVVGDVEGKNYVIDLFGKINLKYLLWLLIVVLVIVVITKTSFGAVKLIKKEGGKFTKILKFKEKKKESFLEFKEEISRPLKEL